MKSARALVFIILLASFSLASWSYFLPFKMHINNNQSEYQVLLNLDTEYLISNGMMNPDCSDIRVGNSTNSSSFFPIWIEPGTCNTTETYIWVKFPYVTDNETFYIITGNKSATSVSNESLVFSYSSPVPIYYVVSNYTSEIKITGFQNDTRVVVKSANGTELENTTLGRMQTISVSGVGLGTSILANKPIYVEGNGEYDDAMVPIGFAGTYFTYTGFRDSNDTFCFLAPYSSANVTVKDAGSLWWNGSVNSSGTCIQKDVSTSNAIVVRSDKPILAYYYGAGSYDSYPMYPASKELYGIPSRYLWTSAGKNLSSTNYYSSNGSTGAISTSANLGSDIYINGPKGEAPAYKLVSDHPISAIQWADWDGTESTTFLPRSEFGTVFAGGENLQYIAIATVNPDTKCKLESGSGSVNLTTSSFSNGVGKIYYKSSSAISAPWILECNAPVYAYYEYDQYNSERNAFSQVQSRRGPEIQTTPLAESPSFSLKNVTLEMTSRNPIKTFHVNSSFVCSGNCSVNAKLTVNQPSCEIDEPLKSTTASNGTQANLTWNVSCSLAGECAFTVTYTAKTMTWNSTSGKFEPVVLSKISNSTYILAPIRYFADLKTGNSYLPEENVTAILSLYDFSGPVNAPSPDITVYWPNSTEMENSTMSLESTGLFKYSFRLPEDSPAGDYLIIAKGKDFIATAVFQVRNSTKAILEKLDQILANQSSFSHEFANWNTTFYFWNNTYFANWDGQIMNLSSNWDKLWDELNCTHTNFTNEICQYLEAIQLTTNSTNRTVNSILENQTRFFPRWDANWRALWDKFNCSNGTNKLCDYLTKINNTTMNVKSSQELNFKSSLVDTGRVQYGNNYLATLVITNYTNSPIDADINPTVQLYDPSGSLAYNGTMNKSGTGYYVFSKKITGQTGNWETTVTTRVNGVILQLHSYWELVGSAPQVRVLGFSDRVIPGVTAQAEIENEGNAAFEYHYVYCFTLSKTEECGDPTNICYGTGSKLIKPKEIWVSSFRCNRILDPGRYWFKILVYWGSETSSASQDFYAVPEKFKNYHFSEPVLFVRSPGNTSTKNNTQISGGIALSVSPLESTWDVNRELPVILSIRPFGNFSKLPVYAEYTLYNEAGGIVSQKTEGLVLFPASLDLLKKISLPNIEPGKYKICSALEYENKKVESCAPVLLVSPNYAKDLQAASIQLSRASISLEKISSKLEELEEKKKMIGGSLLVVMYLIAAVYYMASTIRIKRKVKRVRLYRIPRKVVLNVIILVGGLVAISIFGLLTLITHKSSFIFYGALGTSLSTILLALVGSPSHETK